MPGPQISGMAALIVQIEFQLNANNFLLTDIKFSNRYINICIGDKEFNLVLPLHRYVLSTVYSVLSQAL